MKPRPTRSLSLILAVLALLAGGLACGRRGQVAPAPDAIVVTTPTGATAAPVAPAAPTSTSAPGGCSDGLQFVADVSVPDGTVFAPGEPFLKTWRLRNAGSCDWTGYQVVFLDGEPMGTMEQLIPDMPAGEEFDLTLEMTAPGGAGSYTGRWQVRSPAGAHLGTLTCVIAVESEQDDGEEAPPDEPAQEPGEQPQEEPEQQPDEQTASPPADLAAAVQGDQLVISWQDAVGEDSYMLSIGTFDAQLEADATSYTWEDAPCGTSVAVTLIARTGGAEIGRLNLTGVETPPCAAEPETVTLQSLPAEDGLVRGLTSGEGISAGGDIKVGDGSQNRGQQGFLSFDISAIPQDAIVQSAVLDLSNASVAGQPFVGLGRLRLYRHAYGTLDVGDFIAGSPGGFFAEYDSRPRTLDVTSCLQNDLELGRPRFQIRLQFEQTTDDDGRADALVFPEGGPALTVTYSP